MHELPIVTKSGNTMRIVKSVTNAIESDEIDHYRAVTNNFPISFNPQTNDE